MNCDTKYIVIKCLISKPVGLFHRLSSCFTAKAENSFRPRWFSLSAGDKKAANGSTGCC